MFSVMMESMQQLELFQEVLLSIFLSVYRYESYISCECVVR